LGGGNTKAKKPKGESVTRARGLTDSADKIKVDTGILQKAIDKPKTI
jgi:hypothetical protein